MKAHGDEAVAVVEIDRVAGEVLPGGERHDAVGRGVDDGARRGLEIGAAMGAASLAVEDPAGAEAAAFGEPGERRAEGQGEVERRGAAEDRRRLPLLALDPRQLGGGRRDVLLLDAGEPLGRVGVARDGELALLGPFRRAALDLDRAGRQQVDGEVADTGDRRRTSFALRHSRMPSPGQRTIEPGRTDLGSDRCGLLAGKATPRAAQPERSVDDVAWSGQCSAERAAESVWRGGP